jgi:multicomponent Na+:H+ antiporter subunit C
MHWLNENILHYYNYWLCILLMGVGLYAVISAGNLVKKLIGLTIFQTSVLLFYISIGYVEGARFPIIQPGVAFYINPLPHVLMLTAIVVGVATFAVGLALAVRIKESYGTVEEDEILAADNRPPSLSFAPPPKIAPMPKAKKSVKAKAPVSKKSAKTKGKVKNKTKARRK